MAVNGFWELIERIAVIGFWEPHGLAAGPWLIERIISRMVDLFAFEPIGHE